MRFLFLLFIHVLLFISYFFTLLNGFALADVYLKSHTVAERKLLSSKFQFYRVPFKTINPTPLFRYCHFSNDKAQLYLQTKADMAEIDATAAYHYGTLIGFAPCLEQDLKKAMTYLKMSSDNGNKDASYLLGTIYFKRNDIDNAKKYFIRAARNFHPEANYNYALIESNNFKYINQLTISLLKNAANSGNLKAQHDQSIVILKLFLHNKIKLQKSEIVRLNHIFNNIIDNTNDIVLKEKATKNLNNFISLTKRLIVAYPAVKQAHLEPSIMKFKQQIDFARLEEQAFKEFNDDYHVSNNINRP